ncbi:GRAM domain-containing protein YSP2 [Pichia kudriavzevii]|uniref:GRAM domain-containing protein YSP2 n=1 Tax=Pichia kudriavzevii TaxID=4909 RepID=A0A1V2LM27_PICKU|nr:GRAM domain-containing protein YSP2 [Pichia kudriavzevii]
MDSVLKQRRVSSIPRLPDDDSGEVITSLPPLEKSLPPLPLASSSRKFNSADDIQSNMSTPSTSSSTTQSSLNVAKKSEPTVSTTTTHISYQNLKEDVSVESLGSQLDHLNESDETQKHTQSETEAEIDFQKGGIVVESGNGTEMLSYRRHSRKGTQTENIRVLPTTPKTTNNSAMSSPQTSITTSYAINSTIPDYLATPKQKAIDYNLYTDEKYLDTQFRYASNKRDDEFHHQTLNFLETIWSKSVSLSQKNHEKIREYESLSSRTSYEGLHEGVKLLSEKDLYTIDGDTSNEESDSESSGDQVDYSNSIKSDAAYVISPDSESRYPGPKVYQASSYSIDYEATGETVVLEKDYQIPLGLLFEIFFGDDISFHKNMMVLNDGENFTDYGGLNMEGDKRSFEYDKKLNYPIGPSSTRVYCTEKLEHLDYEDHIEVLNITKTPNVPSGSSFDCRTRYLFKWSQNGKSKLIITFKLEWSGTSWFKNIIESSAKSGQMKAANDVDVELLKTIPQKMLDNEVSYEDTNPLSIQSRKTDKRFPGPKSQSASTYSFNYKENNETVVLDTEFSIPMGLLFQIIFGDDLTFHKRLMELGGSSNISEYQGLVEGRRERSYEYDKALNYSIGPKSTHVYCTEKILHLDYNDHIEVLNISKTPDVPSGSAFDCRTRFLFKWGETGSTKLIISYKLEWTGSSWFKGVIESSALSGQKKVGEDVNIELLKIIPQKVIEFGVNDETTQIEEEIKEVRKETRADKNVLPIEKEVGFFDCHFLSKQVIETPFGAVAITRIIVILLLIILMQFGVIMYQFKTLKHILKCQTESLSVISEHLLNLENHPAANQGDIIL